MNGSPFFGGVLFVVGLWKSGAQPHNTAKVVHFQSAKQPKVHHYF